MPLSARAVMVSALLVGLSVAIMSASGGTAQEEHERTVERQSFGNEPVKIKAVRAKKNDVTKDIVVGKKFADADDWLKGLTVNVENKSNKNVNYVSVLIVYSRVENDEASNEAPLGDSLTYGASPFRQSSAPPQVQAIPPGGSAELVLTERAYDENVLALKNLKYKKSVKKIELSVEEVGFEDGTAWSKGQYWKPDPDKPGHWIPLEREAARTRPHAPRGLLLLAQTTRGSSLQGVEARGRVRQPVPIPGEGEGRARRASRALGLGRVLSPRQLNRV